MKYTFQVFGTMSLCMVLISTTTFVLQTVPEFQENGEYPVVYKLLEAMDIIAMVFFIFEYFTRLLCCPKKIAFLTRHLIYIKIPMLYYIMSSLHLRIFAIAFSKIIYQTCFCLEKWMKWSKKRSRKSNW